MNIFPRDDAWNLCNGLNGPDPIAALPQIRTLVLKLLADYLTTHGQAPFAEVKFDQAVQEWLTKDGWRWLPKDNMQGLGPSLSNGLAVLDILDTEVGSLDPSKTHLLAKWVWRKT